MSAHHPEHTLDNPPATAPVDAPPTGNASPELPADRVVFSEVVPGGGHWSWRLSRGMALRFVALDAGANCSVVLYAAHNPLERYNMPDSLKAQHTAHYSRGHVLMSDMGRAMASVTEDSLGWHDLRRAARPPAHGGPVRRPPLEEPATACTAAARMAC
jgi:uncharacterized protein YcgI (DUF1989 family)